MKTKAAIYARVSLKDGRQRVENQLRLLREYAEREGLQVVKEYVDHGTGGNGNGLCSVLTVTAHSYNANVLVSDARHCIQLPAPIASV